MSHIELNRCLRELAKLFTVFSPFSSFQPFLLYTSMCIPYARHGYTLGLVTVHFSLHVHGELNLPNIIVTKWNSWHVQSLLCWSFVIQHSSTTTKVVTKFSVFCAHPVIVCGICNVPHFKASTWLCLVWVFRTVDVIKFKTTMLVLFTLKLFPTYNEIINSSKTFVRAPCDLFSYHDYVHWNELSSTRLNLKGLVRFEMWILNDGSSVHFSDFIIVNIEKMIIEGQSGGWEKYPYFKRTSDYVRIHRKETKYFSLNYQRIFINVCYYSSKFPHV